MKQEILSLNDQGQGICYFENKIVFIPKCVPKDIVDYKIIKEHKKYCEAKLTNIVKKSIKRVDAFCPYYNDCGGCHLQNLSYEDTLKFKKNKVKNIFHKFANMDIDLDIERSNNIKNYRNKITLKIKDKQIGLYEYQSNTLVKINNCLIVSDEINNFIKEISKLNIENGQIIIRSNSKKELLINILSLDNINIDNINLDNVKGIVLNDKVIYKDDFFIEEVSSYKFKVSYNSFFQINNDILNKISIFINENILKNENVLDLYCGVGVLGILSSSKSNKIYGIEIVKNAIKNAKENSLLNNIKNATYYSGDVSKLLNEINDDINVYLIDPPRSGLDKNTINIILEKLPKQIIYVSCDPITLARDINYLKEKYDIKNIKVFDMFPYTYHCESITILERR